MALKVAATLEEMGRLPMRVLNFLLSEFHPKQKTDALTLKERQNLMRTEQLMMIIRAGLYGIISGIGIVIVVLAAEPLRPESLTADWTATAKYYGITGSFGVVITIIELAAIYADTLRTARSLSVISGIRPPIIDEDTATDEMILSLMYAGLRAPNPHEELYGINPREHLNKLFLLLGMAAHKSKVKITRIIIKALYRRIFVRVSGRTASRAVIETISIPVFALWNMIVVHRVMREIRIRALVPLHLAEMEEMLYPGGFEKMPKNQRTAALLAIKAQVVHVHDFHPNVTLFLDRLLHRLSPEEILEFEENEDDFVRYVETLDEQGRRTAIMTYCVTCGLDGRIRRRHRKMFKKLTKIHPAVGDCSPRRWWRYFLSGGERPDGA